MSKIFCPFCGNDAIWRKGKTAKGKQRYYCRICETSFVDRREEDLTDRELEHLKKNLNVTISYEWRNWSVDLDDHVERSLFSKLPTLPLEVGESDPLEVLVAKLAAELQMDVYELEKKVYRAIAAAIRT